MGKVTRKPGPARIALEQLVKDAPGMEARVGWVDGSSYPDDRGGQPVAYVAAIMELGYAEGGIPPRPTIAPTVQANKDKWKQQMRGLAKKVGAGSLTLEQAFDQLGLQAAGDLKKTIAEFSEPGLKESTLEARARRKNTTADKVNKQPLNDEGILVNSVTHEVTKS